MGGIPGMIPGLGNAGDMLSELQGLLGKGQDFAQKFDANIGNELCKKLDVGGGPNGQPTER